MMRRTLVFVCCAVLLAAGCDDDEVEEDPTDVGMDAADAVADTGDVAVDAAPDATPDAPGMDAADTADASGTDGGDAGSPGMANLTVQLAGQGVSGVEVIVHGPDGAVDNQVTTDASGQVEFQVASGGMVTVVEESSIALNFPAYYTITDVEPGDSIVVNVPADTNSSSVGQVEVSLPGSFGANTQANVTIGCEVPDIVDPTQSTTLDIDPGCVQTGDVIDVVAFSEDSNGDEVAYAVQNDLSFTQGGTTQANLANWQTTFNDLELTIDGLPSGATPEANTMLLADGVEFPYGITSSQAAGGQDTQILTFQYIPGFADTIRYEGGFIYVPSDNGVQAANLLVGFEAGASSDKSVTVSAGQLLPNFESVSVQDQASARPTMTWSTRPVVAGGPTLDEADMGRVSLGFSGGAPGGWLLIVPSDVSQVKVPELPAGMRTPADGTLEGAFVNYIDADMYSDYADVKAMPPASIYNLGEILLSSDGGRTTGASALSD